MALAGFGVVHASVNSTATVLYGTSWLARRKRAHRTAVTHGHGDGLVATLGGSFGGHLTLVRKIVTPTPPSVRPAVKTASRVGRGRTMSKPQQPELHRSGLGATDPASAKAAAEVGGAGRVAGATGPVPEDNLPGHHPAQDQDKPEGPPSGAAR